MRRLGSLRFYHLEDRGEIRRHLPRFFDQHILRRALAGGRSHFLVAENRLFYEHLIDGLDPSRELRFGVLELDGRPLAYHLGFEVNGRFTWYKPSFDVDYWDLSPERCCSSVSRIRSGSAPSTSSTSREATRRSRTASPIT